MSRLFGTDGVRGLANGTLTAELALGLAQAAAQVLTMNQGKAAQQQAQAQAGQFGAQLGLSGLGQANQAAFDLGQLGTQQQAAQLNALQAQASAGQQQQALQQQDLNTAYQNFMNQLNWPMQQLSNYSSLIHGLPVQMGQTSTVSTPAPSMLAQLSGAGLGALSLSKLFGG